MEEDNNNIEVDNMDKKLHIPDAIDSDDSVYIGSVCDKCGEISNHDEIDGDICIHCKTRFGTWKHIYESPI